MPLVSKIAIGSDHAGFALKKAVIPVVELMGIEVIDMGVNDHGSVDYPDFGSAVAKAVQSGDVPMGIVVCGTGIGISIVANRYKGVRAALCHDEDVARLTREHNNANILALAGRTDDFERALRIVRVFLSTPYEEVERHQRRIEKIDSVCACDDEI